MSTDTEHNGKRETEELLKKERNFISAILETTGALVVLMDPQGRFIRINDAFEKLSGYTIIELLGNPFWEMILPEIEIEESKLFFGKILAGKYPLEQKGSLKSREGELFNIIWTVTALKGEDGAPEYIIYTGIDITPLQEALSRIKTLSGLLPICSFCKKIRDDRGYWNMLEEYIRDHSEANFSHGMCPECMQKHYPQYAKKKEEK